MRILFAHNRYQQAGGEDVVVQAEMSLLRANGHEVSLCEVNNDSILGWRDAASTALQCVYSIAAARDMNRQIERFNPDLAHVHNFFPRLSPSIHYVCHKARIPVVQTLHNYRLLCAGGNFLRNGKVCEDCMGKVIPWPAVQHGCYRQSKVGSVAAAGMIAVHQACGTWRTTVNRFIALTEFGRMKFIEGGLPQDRVVVKPNFVHPDPGMGAGDGGYALFVGRLSAEKGIETLLAAWSQVHAKQALKIIGDGPLAPKVTQAAHTDTRIEWLGRCSREQVVRSMAMATFLILPSIWYEGLPLVIPEAFASGTPIIASRLGALAELIAEGRTGMFFNPLRDDDLAHSVDFAFSRPEFMRAMRHGARLEFEAKYSAGSNYGQLINIYEAARQEVIA